jgi:hypothetical protein
MNIAYPYNKARTRDSGWVATILRGCIAVSLLLLASGAVRAEEVDSGSPPVVPAAPAKGSVFADPLGFLLFGPTLGAELGLGQYSVVAYGRWLDGGLLAKSLFESSTDKFTFSYGAGLKGRYYFTQGLMGPHVGVAFEALKTRTENHTDRVATNNLVLVPEVEGGYRFGFGRFFVGGTLGVGYALQVSSSVVNIDGGNQAGNYEAKDVSTIYGSANLDVGVLF